MAITKVWIEDGCIVCGCAPTTCPEVFEIDEEIGTTIVKVNVDYSQYEQGIRDAAYSCPIEIIKFEM